MRNHRCPTLLNLEPRATMGTKLSGICHPKNIVVLFLHDELPHPVMSCLPHVCPWCCRPMENAHAAWEPGNEANLGLHELCLKMVQLCYTPMLLTVLIMLIRILFWYACLYFMSMWWLIRLAICHNIGVESLGPGPRAWCQYLTYSTCPHAITSMYVVQSSRSRLLCPLSELYFLFLIRTLVAASSVGTQGHIPVSTSNHLQNQAWPHNV